MSVVTTTETLSPTSRVWIYQADRPFSEEDLPAIRESIAAFARSWISHNRQLQAFGDVYHDRFVVLMVDESGADASGCSIDSSVHFLKRLGQQFGVDLFDRLRFSYFAQDEVHTVDRDTFAELYASGAIGDDTLVFDTLVNTREAFERSFLKPLKESWHARLV